MILAVAILIATAFSGLFLGWEYLQGMQMSDQGLRDTTVLGRIASSVASRVTQVLQLTGPAGNCNATLVNTDLGAFRNFNNPAPEVNLTLANAEILGCLVKSNEYINATSTVSPLNSLTITLQQIGAPDQTNLFSTISISVVASSQRGAHGAKAAHSASVSSKVLLWVQKMSSYNLVLFGGPAGFRPGNWQIAVTNPVGGTSPSLEIKGSVLYADQTATNPLPLNSVVQTTPGTPPTSPLSPITIDGSFDIQASSFNYTNTNAPSGCPISATCPLDLSQMDKTFKGGINVNTMYQAINTLPFYDSALGNGLADPWTNSIDFNVGASKTYATSFLAGGKSSYGADASGPAADPPAPGALYTGGDTNYSGLAANLFFVGTVGVGGSVIPTSGTNANSGILQLDNTCKPEAPPDTPPPNEFVFMQWTRNLGIDFTGSNTGGQFPIFCGLIVANNLFINAPAGGTFYIFGLIIAHSVTVMGGGAVVIVNPLENDPLSPNPLAPGETQSGIAADMSWLANTYGHNFFVPVFQNLAGLPTSLDTYRPHGPLRATKCCGAPTSIGDTAGYLCPCAGSTSDICPLSSPVDGNYCYATPASPSALQNMNNLFSAATIPKLVFMTKVVQ